MSLNYGNKYTCNCEIAKLPNSQLLGIGKWQTQSILSLKGLKLPDRPGYSIHPVCSVFAGFEQFMRNVPKGYVKAPVFVFHQLESVSVASVPSSVP